jgi:hypothetical protein
VVHDHQTYCKCCKETEVFPADLGGEKSSTIPCCRRDQRLLSIADHFVDTPTRFSRTSRSPATSPCLSLCT